MDALFFNCHQCGSSGWAQTCSCGTLCDPPTQLGSVNPPMSFTDLISAGRGVYALDAHERAATLRKLRGLTCEEAHAAALQATNYPTEVQFAVADALDAAGVLACEPGNPLGRYASLREARAIIVGGHPGGRLLT